MRIPRAWIFALALTCAPAAHAGGRVLVLSGDDEAAYRAAFASTDLGDWQKADAALARAADRSLVSHALARRYTSDAYTPNRDELVDWLRQNPDHPFFALIQARAQSLGASSLPKAAGAGSRPYPLAGSTPQGDSAAARQAIELAAQRFAENDLAGAAELAQGQLSGPRRGPAEWQLGLVAFKQKRWREAAAHFDAAAAWPNWDAWGASAVRYWAARAHLAAGNPKASLAQFKAALAYPSTFYGQLAEAQLGRDSRLDFKAPTIDPKTALDFMLRHPEARRAAALAQIDRLSDVETELKALHNRLKPNEDRTFLDFADALSAPSAQLRAAEFGGPAEGWGYCPTMSFAPENGFKLDRAALFAVARQESRYNPVAISSSNARGLMQLLPSTAQDMEKSKPIRSQPTLLHDPGLNMRLGQSYLEWLMSSVAKDGDLMKLFAAYNGGPGWLSRYLAANPDARDPLMLIESLPRAESRDYAERVLSHMALCRKRLGQPAKEFEELAAGKPARYVRLDR